MEAMGIMLMVRVAAGMCLLDTTDGALMMTLYTSTSLARDTVAILYYSIVLSAITVMVAVCIGTIQLLSLIANFSTGRFWNGVDAVGDHFDVIGGGICGAFVVFGVLSVVLYRPWRRRMDRQRRTGAIEAVELGDVEDKKVDDEKNIGGGVVREVA
jgi:high-affinity nickel-transport protein